MQQIYTSPENVTQTMSVIFVTFRRSEGLVSRLTNMFFGPWIQYFFKFRPQMLYLEFCNKDAIFMVEMKTLRMIPTISQMTQVI